MGASSSRLDNAVTVPAPDTKPLCAPGDLADHFSRTCRSQQELRSAGSLKLFRAPRREPGSYCTPSVRGVSIRMNRSQREGSKRVDHGVGRFESSLNRHFNVAPAGQACICELSSEVDFLALEFPAGAFEEHLGRHGDLGRLHAECQTDELVMQLVERLWRESAAGLTRLEADGLGLALVSLLVRASRSEPRQTRDRYALNDRRLSRLMEYIEDHLADDFSVLELSQVGGVSTTAITSGFREAIGCSPWQFVLMRRVERAKLELTLTQLTITQVALKYGFSSSQHFATVFKKFVGTTPTDYRRKWMS